MRATPVSNSVDDPVSGRIRPRDLPPLAVVKDWATVTQHIAQDCPSQKKTVVPFCYAIMMMAHMCAG